MKVLVVDDHEPIREMLQTVLEFEGLEVTFAENGAQALIAVESERPDVIVLDVMMPELDGFSVAEELAARGCDIPIVFCTAKGDEEDTWRGWQLGASSYVTKPFDSIQFVEEILRIGAERAARA